MQIQLVKYIYLAVFVSKRQNGVGVVISKILPYADLVVSLKILRYILYDVI